MKTAMAVDVYVLRRGEKAFTVFTCAICPPGVSYTWWCSPSVGFLLRGKKTQRVRQLIIILLLDW